ncbi:type 1 periplasmic binding fold superfamily protein [Maribacter aestuarii]|uniref:type 1 periplasmic binding fold superfamily protein n=1 Tax=Maribacter aestuarii TaxID=1130723 RepID=UPI00248ABB78|nr:type 1 periplasmic binding fold superfamily protein [Maribacter aestuarii]
MKTMFNLSNSLHLKSLFLLSIMGLMLTSCSSDDDNPDPVDEEEVITTMNVNLVATGAGTVTLQSQDLDGDGPNAPQVTISGNLTANTTYAGSIELLNETETPAEDITEEVEEEDEEHQFFFNTSGALTGFTYADQDGNGNPVGIEFTLDTGDAGSGSLQITLRHEPKKPNDGSLADAGGETDIAQTFNLTVE